MMYETNCTEITITRWKEHLFRSWPLFYRTRIKDTFKPTKTTVFLQYSLFFPIGCTVL